MPSASTVETESEYIHVRFRDPDQFDGLRTLGWAEYPAHSVSEGSEDHMGQEEASDDWIVQSVLMEKSDSEDNAEAQATEIGEKIES